MGSLIVRNGIYYYQWYLNGKLHKKSLQTTEKATAKRLFTLHEARLEQVKTGIAPKRTKFESAFSDFLARKQPTVRATSYMRYEEEIRTLGKFLADEGVEYVHQLKSEHLSRFIAFRRAKNRAPKTIKEELTILQGVLKMLIEDGTISESPLLKWPTIKITTKRPERIGHYSHQEVAALKKQFEGKEFHDIFLFFIFTGARREEAREARVRDVREKTICIRNLKTETSPENQFRILEIHPDLWPIIEERIKDKQPGDYIFPEMHNHSRNWPAVQVKAACKATHIEYRRLHGLRHTFISSLLNTGTAVRAVMKMVGHQDMDTTLRYAHVSQDDLKGKIARLDFGLQEKAAPVEQDKVVSVVEKPTEIQVPAEFSEKKPVSSKLSGKKANPQK